MRFNRRPRYTHQLNLKARKHHNGRVSTLNGRAAKKAGKVLPSQSVRPGMMLPWQPPKQLRCILQLRVFGCEMKLTICFESWRRSTQTHLLTPALPPQEQWPDQPTAVEGCCTRQCLACTLHHILHTTLMQRRCWNC